MTTDAEPFNSKLTAWKEYQSTPWGRLRYELTLRNLERHLQRGPLQILDVGGGNGRDAIPLAKLGHVVTLLDFSPEMLNEAVQAAAQTGISDRLKIILGDTSEIPSHFPQPAFDVVLCHNILQYIQDAASVLQAIGSVMYSGGWLSVINPNPCSETYRQALLQLDLKAALDSLDQTAANTALFGVEMRLFTREQLVEMLSSASFQLVADYGIRCVTDYIQNNEIKAQAEFYEQLVSLEQALSERIPYKYLARFFHILAQKETIE